MITEAQRAAAAELLLLLLLLLGRGISVRIFSFGSWGRTERAVEGEKHTGHHITMSASTTRLLSPSASSSSTRWEAKDAANGRRAVCSSERPALPGCARGNFANNSTIHGDAGREEWDQNRSSVCDLPPPLTAEGGSGALDPSTPPGLEVSVVGVLVSELVPGSA